MNLLLNLKGPFSVTNQFLGNKIKTLANGFFRGLHFKIEGVPIVNEVTIEYLNVREIEIQSQEQGGRLKMQLQAKAVISRLPFEIDCDLSSSFGVKDGQIHLGEVKTEISSSKDPLTAMLLQKSLDSYLPDLKLKLPAGLLSLGELFSVKEEDENDVVTFSYQAYKSRKSPQQDQREK